MSVLIVEDDIDIRSLLRRGFSAEGYDVVAVANGERAMEEVRIRSFDTVILDLMLPGMSGIHVCEKLRLMGIEATILILSARDRVADRIEGFEAGADDYVVKPFSFAEVLARVRAQERHRRRDRIVDSSKQIVSGSLILDLAVQEVRHREKRIALTTRESDLLQMFIRRIDEPLTREDIFEALWADQGGSTMNVVDVYIGYLRRKLALIGIEARQVIRTVRGVGFVYKHWAD